MLPSSIAIAPCSRLGLGAKSPPRRRREASLVFQMIDTRHYKNVRAVVYINLDDDSSYIKRNFTFSRLIEKANMMSLIVFPQILH